MEFVVEGILVAGLLQLVPLGIVVGPVVVFFVISRRSVAAVAAWAVGVLFLVLWFLAGIADVERSNAPGEVGNVDSGWYWIALATLAATASVMLSVRTLSRPGSDGGSHSR